MARRGVLKVLFFVGPKGVLLENVFMKICLAGSDENQSSFCLFSLIFKRKSALASYLMLILHLICQVHL